MKGLTQARNSAGLVAGLFLSGAAQAITDNFFRYSEPKTGSYSIHPAALSPFIDGTDYATGEARESLTSNSSTCYQTGVNLPQGAKITTLRVWYESNNINDLYFRLFRTQFLYDRGRLNG